jgi:hypothetical protein
MFLLELAILIISLLAGAYSLRSWWMASERPAETTPDGSLMLRFSRNTFWLGFLSLVLGVGLIIAALSLGRGIETVISLFIMGGAIAFGGIWLMSQYFNSRLIVNNRYIKQRKWLGQDIIIDWARLDKVKFSVQSGYFILTGMKGEKIRVSRMLRGFNEFKGILNIQVPEARMDKESMQEYKKLQQMEKELLDELRGIG